MPTYDVLCSQEEPPALNEMPSPHNLLNAAGPGEQRLNGERTDDQACKRHALVILEVLQSSKISHTASTDENAMQAHHSYDYHPPTSAKSMGPPLTPSNKRAAQKARIASRSPSVPNSEHLPDEYEGSDSIVELMNSLADLLQRSMRTRCELGIDRILVAAVPYLGPGVPTQTRAAAYRLVRHSLVVSDTPLSTAWCSFGLDIYIMRSLLRDRSCLFEREQALKLIRAVLELPFFGLCGVDGPSTNTVISEGTVRAIVAAAESVDDPMRQVYIQTLAELALFDLPSLLRANGLGTILHSLVDGAQEIAPEIIKILLFLTDRPTTRCYFRRNTDLEYALSGFTDLPTYDAASQVEVLQTSANIVGVMLRSWTGLFYLCMNRRRAIVSLITAMKVSSTEVQESIIQMLIDVFDVSLGIERMKQRDRAQAQSDLPELGAAERRNLPSRTAREMSYVQRERNRHRITLIDQYLSILLIVFVESGLVDALVHILQNSSATSRSATLLMGTLLQMGNRVLPQNYNVSINQLPELFASASQFNNPNRRNKAVTALSAVSSASAFLHRQSQLSEQRFIGRSRSKSLSEGPAMRPQRQGEAGKMLQGLNIDDATFRSQIVETQVLNTRDATKWNVSILMSLLQGPLLNPRRLDEAMRGTKLLKRLLAFFHPFALRYSDLPATPPNKVFTRIGCTLLTTLIATPDGLRFIAEDVLLREIYDAFHQIVPTASDAVSPTVDPIFAKSRVTSTLSQGYFEMIGTLSASSEGVSLLARFNIWSAMYRLCQSQSRDDIVRVMIEKLDFTLEGHPRVLLGWVLTAGSRPLRTFATELLIKLIRKSPSPGEWMISLLLTQLCDPAASIRNIAVAVVQDICHYPQILETVVSLRPTLDHLGEIGHELLLHFLSTPGGVRYLLEGDYIDREMDEWFNERSQRYSVQMEVSLARAFSIYRNKLDPCLDEVFSGVPPLHFYGELVKTAEGCEVLNQKGHFLEFAHFIRQHGMEGSDGEILNKLKSILWTVGNIGATAGGFPFLEQDGTIATIVDIAEHSPVLTIRGTCFYVISLISTTRQGAELLYDYGWQSLCTTFGLPLGICVPQNIDSFLHIEEWDTVGITSENAYSALTPPHSSLHQSILASISNLGNSILTNKAAKTLSRLRHRHRSAFSDIRLFARVLELLNGFKFRHGVRRFVWELFDIELTDRNVQRLVTVRQDLYRPVGLGSSRHSSVGSLLYGSRRSEMISRSATLPSIATVPPTAASSPALPRSLSTTPSVPIAHISPLRRAGLLEQPNPLEGAYADGDDVYDDNDDLDVHEDVISVADDDDNDSHEEIVVLDDDDVDDCDGVLAPTRAHRLPLSSIIQHSKTSIAGEGGRGLGHSLGPTRTAMNRPRHEFSVGSSVVVDGFGEQKSPAVFKVPRHAPPPGIRVIGGFGSIDPSSL